MSFKYCLYWNTATQEIHIERYPPLDCDELQKIDILKIDILMK